MKTISEKEVWAAVETSWKELSKNYQPDHIVAISHGGDSVGDLFSELSSVPLSKILIQRPDRKPLYKKLVKINKHFAWFVYELLFLLDKPKIIERIIIPQNKNILIVDDGVHTGKTIQVCVNFLKRFHPKSTFVFSLMDISKNKLSNYSHYNEKITFPWSENYIN